MLVLVKKRNILVLLLCLIFLFSITVGVYINNASTVTPVYDYVIVIDAGHGGIDGGVVGASGQTKESDINLEYALCLATYFNSMNCKVVQTRTTQDGLYSMFSTNKKMDDMKKREEIINNAEPDIVISIHQNGFVLENQRGIGTFFNPNVEGSQELAEFMQSRFQATFEYARVSALAGDYFILNCSPYNSVLVECGFLTNPEEEILLNTEEHKLKVCYQIFCSIIGYLITSRTF